MNQEEWKIKNSLIPWLIISIVQLRSSNRRPIKVLVNIVMTSNFVLKKISHTSTWKFTVAKGASNCPMTTKSWNSCGGFSFNVFCRVSNRILRKLASGMALHKAPASMRSSVFNSPKSFGKYSILYLFFNDRFVESRKNVVSPFAVT